MGCRILPRCTRGWLLPWPRLVFGTPATGLDYGSSGRIPSWCISPCPQWWSCPCDRYPSRLSYARFPPGQIYAVNSRSSVSRCWWNYSLDPCNCTRHHAKCGRGCPLLLSWWIFPCSAGRSSLFCWSPATLPDRSISTYSLFVEPLLRVSELGVQLYLFAEIANQQSQGSSLNFVPILRNKRALYLSDFAICDRASLRGSLWAHLKRLGQTNLHILIAQSIAFFCFELIFTIL